MMLSKAQTWYLSVLAAAATVTTKTSAPATTTGVYAWSPSSPITTRRTTTTTRRQPNDHLLFGIESRTLRSPAKKKSHGYGKDSRDVSMLASKSSSSSSSSVSEDESTSKQQQRRVEVDDEVFDQADHALFQDIAATTDTNSNRNNVTSSSLPLASEQREQSISRALAKKIRVAKAQAEIDRILSLPDSAPFDVEAELEKVISIAPRVSATTTTAAALPSPLISQSSSMDKESLLDHHANSSDDHVVLSASTTNTESCLSTTAATATITSDLEAELYQAVKQQDYELAAQKRLALDQCHMDDSLAVLQVNAAFYQAFSKKDARQMEALWLQDDCVTSIHPSHEPIVGCKAVNLSWKRMFSSSNGSFQRNWMEPCNIRLAVKGGGGGSGSGTSATSTGGSIGSSSSSAVGTDGTSGVGVVSGGTMAVVTCDERIYARRFVRGQRRQTELVNTLTATNIFRKVDGKWYMVHHHASWHVDSEPAKHALQKASGSGSSGTSSALIDSLQKRQQATEPKDTLKMDGILGIPNFGPLLGDSKSSDDAANKPRRRIVMGSLSDILNGDLGDILGNAGSSDGKKDTNANDNAKNLGEGSAIIQFHRLDAELDDEEDEDDDDDDLDEDDVDVDLDDLTTKSDNMMRSNKKALSILKEWAASRDKETKGAAAPNTKSAGTTKKQPTESSAIRQRCIASLRHLCQQGLISNRQKRVLLTDIVSCAAKGEKSMVEVAYELLLLSLDDTDDADTDDVDDHGTTIEDQRAIAQEEFADQCRIFAESHGLDAALH